MHLSKIHLLLFFFNFSFAFCSCYFSKTFFKSQHSVKSQSSLKDKNRIKHPVMLRRYRIPPAPRSAICILNEDLPRSPPNPTVIVCIKHELHHDVSYQVK